jgi:hypothetical protein
MKPIAERNYDLFVSILPIEVLIEKQYVKLAATGFMDLSIEILEEADGGYDIAMAHYYLQNGDMCPDPDMQLFLDPVKKTLTGLSITHAMGLYKCAFLDTNGGHRNLDLRVVEELNKFLGFWLRNLRDQGFSGKELVADLRGSRETA